MKKETLGKMDALIVLGQVANVRESIEIAISHLQKNQEMILCVLQITAELIDLIQQWCTENPNALQNTADIK